MRPLVFLALIVMVVVFFFGVTLSQSEVMRPYTGAVLAKGMEADIEHQSAVRAQELAAAQERLRHEQVMNQQAEIDRRNMAALNQQVVDVVLLVAVGILASIWLGVAFFLAHRLIANRETATERRAPAVTQLAVAGPGVDPNVQRLQITASHMREKEYEARATMLREQRLLIESAFIRAMNQPAPVTIVQPAQGHGAAGPVTAEPQPRRPISRLRGPRK